MASSFQNSRENWPQGRVATEGKEPLLADGDSFLDVAGGRYKLAAGSMKISAVVVLTLLEAVEYRSEARSAPLTFIREEIEKSHYQNHD